jgi:hypothetical protein
MSAGDGTTITFPAGTTDGDRLIMGINSAANDGDVTGSTNPFGFNNAGIRPRILTVSGGATTATITGTGPFLWVCTSHRGGTTETVTDYGTLGFGNWAEPNAHTTNLFSAPYSPALTDDHFYVMLGGSGTVAGLDVLESWQHPRVPFQQPVAVTGGGRFMAMGVSVPITGTVNLGGGTLNVTSVATLAGNGQFGLLL